MNRIYNYMFLACVAFIVAGCIGEFDTNIPSVESGDEVQFGLTLPGLTRTVYGDRQDASGAASYPIYWVNGDKVQVYSPECLEGRNDAEYVVSVASASQNYATSLTPTGVSGVQWGDVPAVFYSVYPSGTYTFSDGGKTIQNLKINFSDEYVVTNGEVTPKQADCLMFAKTGEMEVGSTVNLTYSPIATALMITLQGPSPDNDDSGITNRITKIQSVKLIAPGEEQSEDGNILKEATYIAGNFDVSLCEKGDNVGKYVFSKWQSGSSKSREITAQLYDKTTGGFYNIPAGQSIKLSMFLPPIDGLKLDKNWKIEVLVQSEVTTNDGQTSQKTQTFSKSLSFTEASDATLKPGMVHELPPLPKLDVKDDSEWSVVDWMKNIPRNVYLSEISLPGSWNSLNDEFQGESNTVDEQYNLGVRAFHFDTRWKRTGSRNSYKYNTLGVADGGSTATIDGGRVSTNSDNPTFEDCMSSLAGRVQNNEYMVVICTFAQGAYWSTDSDGRNWYETISNFCEDKPYVFDAKDLSDDTLVGDVLGSIIVIINMEGEFNEVPQNSKCLFVNMPLTLKSADFQPNLNENNIGHIYVSNGNEPVESGIQMYHTHAQITIDGESYTSTQSRDDVMNRGFAPTEGERKQVAQNILKWSRENYGTENYAHDKWMYLGLGGYHVKYSSGFMGIGAGWSETGAASYSAVAEYFNEWIDSEVSKMGTIPSGSTTVVPYYPIGIVLMNFVEDYSDVVSNILLLNNKYRLQYDPSKPSDYGEN